VSPEAIVVPHGTFVLIPPGVVHGFRNDGDVPVRMLNVHAPAGFDRCIGLAD
jgi:mannose-6-phosphate isomerase-like protein (cupin superfamily)